MVFIPTENPSPEKSTLNSPLANGRRYFCSKAADRLISEMKFRRKNKKFQAFSMKRFLRSDAIISRASFPLFCSWPKMNCLSEAIGSKRKMKNMAISGTCSNTCLRTMSIYNGVKKSCQQMRCIRHRKFKMKSFMSQPKFCVKKLWLK